MQKLFQTFWQFDYVRYMIISVAVFAVAIFLANLSRHLLTRLYNHSLDDDDEMLSFDETKINFFKNTIQIAIYTLALVIIFNTIPALRSIGVTLFASAGLLTLVIGFASQQAFSNIVSGVFIIFFKPFRIGDFIQIGKDVSGRVENITARHTVLIGNDNSRIIIPNATISTATIINATIIDKFSKSIVHFNVPYDTNIDNAIAIMRQEAVKHPNFIDNRSHEEKLADEHPVDVVIEDINEQNIKLKMSVWTEDSSKAARMRYDLFKSIKEQFDKKKKLAHVGSNSSPSDDDESDV